MPEKYFYEISNDIMALGEEKRKYCITEYWIFRIFIGENIWKYKRIVQALFAITVQAEFFIMLWD